MKKKIIICLLAIILSFHSLSIATTKKAEASITALIGAGVATGAFTAFASYMVASGYHMQISDMLVYFTNTFYDKVEDHYVAKAGKVNALEKLTYTTLGFLSGNNPLDETALQAEINDIVRANAPSLPVISYLPTNLQDYTNSIQIGNQRIGATIQYITADMVGTSKYTKIMLADVVVMYMKETYSVNTNSVWKDSYPRKSVIELVTINNQKFIFTLDNHYFINANISNYARSGNNLSFKIVSNSNSTQANINIDLGNIFTPQNYDVSIIPDSPAADPTKNIKAVAPNWYDLVSGIAKTPQGILDRMDQDAALQQAILDRLAALEYGQDVPVAAPIVDPITGEVLYNQDIPASTDSDRLWGIGNWLRKIYDAVKSIPTSISNLYNKFITFPEDIANKMGALWNDVIVPGWNNFWDSTKQAIIDAKDGILAIPGSIGAALDGFWDNTLNPFITDIRDAVVAIPDKIDALWDATMDIPMEEIDLSKLNFQGFTTKFPFSIPFDYVNLIKQFVRTPIAPDLRINLHTTFFSIDHTIDIQPINKFIIFFRWAVLGTFIYILLVLTQRMIKW